MPLFVLTGTPGLAVSTRSKLGDRGQPLVSRMELCQVAAPECAPVSSLFDFFDGTPERACNTYDLMVNLAPHICVFKRDIPEVCRYVMQGEVHYGQEGRAKRRFFCFRTQNELVSFFLSFADLQQRRTSQPMLMMECTRKGEPKKWVLDMDGEAEKLYSAGFSTSPESCSEGELRLFETASISYARLILRALYDGGRLRCRQALFAVTRRHQFTADGRCKKASLHITLDAMGTHETWRAALAQAHQRIKQNGYARKCVGGSDVRYTLAVQELDDRAVMRNAAGQNMGTLYSSKPSAKATDRPPMFELVGVFYLDMKTMDTELLDGLDMLAGDAGRFYFVSMLARGPATLELVEMSGDADALRPAGCKGQDSQLPPELVSQRAGVEDLPCFAERMLFDGVEFRGVNTTMESLYANLPICIPVEHRVSGVIKCLKVDRPACCVRYLVASPPSFKQHKSNGCKVCVYRAPGTDTPRVFVMCFGCKCDGWRVAPHPGGVEQSPAMWPWVEIFECDLGTMQQLKSKRRRT